MASKDLVSGLNGDVSIVPAAARTATVTGSAVAVYPGESCTIVVLTGTVTDGTGTFSLEECDTVGGTYTAVAAADIIGTAPVLDTTAAHDNAMFCFGYRGSKNFIKVVCTMAGTTTGQVYAAGVIRGHQRHQPVTSP